jgi:hypothetical protein
MVEFKQIIKLTINITRKKVMTIVIYPVVAYDTCNCCAILLDIKNYLILSYQIIFFSTNI